MGVSFDGTLLGVGSFCGTMVEQPIILGPVSKAHPRLDVFP